MIRFTYFILAPALVLALLSCGGNESTPERPRPATPTSRLTAVDPAGFDAGLRLPDLTKYWTDAETRNGNTYPVSAAVGDAHVIAARLLPGGEFEMRRDGGFKAGSMYSVLTHLERLKSQYWNESRGATAAALMLFADRRAPVTSLLKLCRELVFMQVGNLWLATQDGRDDAVRLLPLFVDVGQAQLEWYHLDREESARTAHLASTPGEEVDTLVHTLSHRGDRLRASGDDIYEAFSNTKVERIQFEVHGELNVAEFARAVEFVSPLGFKDVELFWPALDKPDDVKPALSRRSLVAFEDELGVTRGLRVPTLSGYWRAVSAWPGMPAAAEIDTGLPLLAVRVDSDGQYATRARGEGDWKHHENDSGVLEAMRANAGEIDFNSLVSDLQVLLAVDRATPWKKFLGVLEMMQTARCFRLYVASFDVIGPTLRLVDLSLSVSESSHEPARLVLKRDGAVEDGGYSVRFVAGGDEFNARGSGFTAALTSWGSEVDERPQVLVASLPLDEPCGTMFTVLNSLAWLRMKEVRFATGE